MQPRISIGMIEMPVRVYKVGNGVGTKIFKSLGNLVARYANAGINEYLAISASENGDVPARAFKRTYIVT